MYSRSEHANSPAQIHVWVVTSYFFIHNNGDQLYLFVSKTFALLCLIKGAASLTDRWMLYIAMYIITGVAVCQASRPWPYLHRLRALSRFLFKRGACWSPHLHNQDSSLGLHNASSRINRWFYFSFYTTSMGNDRL